MYAFYLHLSTPNINMTASGEENIPEIGVFKADLPAKPSVDIAPPKKQAIVVYEGDERWQPPRRAGFAADVSDEDENDQEEEASTVSGSEEADNGDPLAKLPSDSEVRMGWPHFDSCDHV